MFPSSPQIQHGESRNPSAVLTPQLRTVRGSLTGLLLNSLLILRSFIYSILIGFFFLLGINVDNSSSGDNPEPNFSKTFFLEDSLYFLAKVLAHECTKM